MTVVAGVDSWSPCWYVDPQSTAAGVFDELASVSAARGALLPYPVAGHRVGWHCQSGMVYAEGHPSMALSGHWRVDHDLLADRRVVVSDGDVSLLSPDRLGEAYWGLVEAMQLSGLPVPASQWATRLQDEGWGLPAEEGQPGFAGVRRCDATVDLSFVAGAAEGLAVLAGVAGVAKSVPRAQAEVRWAKDGSGAVETVYLRGYSGVKILGRWYDKGLESSLAPRGELVRAEDQRRYPRGHRRGIGELEARYVRRKFHERFLPMWQASRGVIVAGPMVIADRLAQLVDAGELTARQAEQLIGYVSLSVRGVRQGRSTVYNRRKRLRELGLVASEGVLQEVEVDLHAVLEQAMDSPSWGACG